MIAFNRLEEINPFKLPGQRRPVQQHVLVLDHPDEPLEPLYFNLLDDLQARDDWRITIVAHTVTGTIGAGFSADLTRRVMQQQQQAAEQMGLIHGQIRALLQQWQKWREDKERLKVYDAIRSSNHQDNENALRILQSRWRRTVNPDYISGDDAKPGADFETWREQSEFEQRQRLEFDRQLLANQLRLLKLQAGWLKPYLHHFQRADHQNDPALVTFTNLYNFTTALQPNYTNSNGAYPYNGLIVSGNTLYGTTALDAIYGAGTVFSISLVPQLTILRFGTNVILTWPTYADGFTLEFATNLVPPVVWNTNLPAPVVVNAQNVVTNGISGAQKFYRLSQ